MKLAGSGEVLLPFRIPDGSTTVMGQAKIRICMVSEAQLNIEGIAQLETLASDRNTGSGIVESHRCADAQRVIGRC